MIKLNDFANAIFRKITVDEQLWKECELAAPGALPRSIIGATTSSIDFHDALDNCQIGTKTQGLHLISAFVNSMGRLVIKEFQNLSEGELDELSAPERVEEPRVQPLPDWVYLGSYLGLDVIAKRDKSRVAITNPDGGAGKTFNLDVVEEVR